MYGSRLREWPGAASLTKKSKNMKEIKKVKDAISIASQNGYKDIEKLLTEFMIANTPSVGKGKVDIWKFLSSSCYRPVLRGVFYNVDRKEAVASDTHVLLVSKPDYKEVDVNSEVECAIGKGAIYNKKGKAITGLYPNYLAVIPQNVPALKMTDRDAVIAAVNKYKVKIKAGTVSYVWIMVADGIYVGLKYVELMLRMPKWEWSGNGYGHAIVYKDDEYTMLVMPLRDDDRHKDGIVIY